jgi:hypothetical protein
VFFLNFFFELACLIGLCGTGATVFFIWSVNVSGNHESAGDFLFSIILQTCISSAIYFILECLFLPMQFCLCPRAFRRSHSKKLSKIEEDIWGAEDDDDDIESEHTFMTGTDGR